MKTALKSTLLSLLVCGICNAIQVSGDIWGALTAEGSPYEVIGDLHVPQCSTLVIEAGCYLDFQGRYLFTIDTSACLKAMGEPGDSIIFTAPNINPGWGSIRFLDNCDSCELNYCIIEKSHASSIPPWDRIFGGGISAYNTNLIIRNCSIRDNEAYEGSGGGIYFENSVVEIIESDISRNHSSRDGAGIYCTDSDLILRSSVISCDTSRYPLGGGWGGGLSINYSNVLLENNIIADNYSDQCGGGIYISRSPAEIINNKIINNTAYDMAGGVSIGACSLVVMTNNIVAYNNAGYVGGGITSSGTDIVLSNNTIYSNSCRYTGGGLLISGSAIDTVSNNIIWRNEVDGDTLHPQSQIDNRDSALVFVYSCIQNGWPGEGNIDTNPMFVEPSHWDFHLRWDNYPSDDDTKSPCIDAGAPWSPLDPDSTRADMGALSFDQLVGIDDDFNDRLPRHIMLYQNYPNPFNASTLIRYELPRQSQVTIDIYDILGRKVQTLQDDLQPAGEYQVHWLAEDLSSGVYFYKIQAGDYNESRRMTLVK